MDRIESEVTDERGTDLVELVAKALYDAIYDAPHWPNVNEEIKGETYDQAKAVLAALEPEFQRRERAAETEVLRRLGREAIDSDSRIPCAERFATVLSWLDKWFDELDVATADTADRTEAG